VKTINSTNEPNSPISGDRYWCYLMVDC
jgi:hypothetical protein